MLELKVWGDYACFTRPENKVERVSYDVMTPSAARGVLEGVFWKPEFEWRVREIHVLKPIRRFSILRNEVNDLISERSAKSWASSGGGYYADDSKNRAQRHALVLEHAGPFRGNEARGSRQRTLRRGEVEEPLEDGMDERSPGGGSARRLGEPVHHPEPVEHRALQEVGRPRGGEGGLHGGSLYVGAPTRQV